MHTQHHPPTPPPLYVCPHLAFVIAFVQCRSVCFNNGISYILRSSPYLGDAIIGSTAGAAFVAVANALRRVEEVGAR